MLQVTERACQQLGSILQENDIELESALRLIRGQGGSLEFAVDSKREGDQVVRSGARQVLLVESELSTAMAGIQLDVENTDKGLQFILSQRGSSDARDDGFRPR